MVEYEGWGTSKTLERVNEGEIEGENIERTFKASLIKRARKRSVHQAHAGWRVDGDSKLSDSLDSYAVTYHPDRGRYDCDCYHNDYGDTRRRKVCSHVLAVMLYRREHEVGGVGNGVAHGDNSTPPSIETSSDSPAPPLFDGDGPELHTIRESTQQEGEATVAYSDVPVGPSPSSYPELGNTEFWGTPRLPAWATELRAGQAEAVEECVDAFSSGKRVLFLDAPTGSGKTLIGELVRRRVRERAAYICTSLTLQDQFLNDFGYAYLLKGRTNYPTLDYPFPEYTAGDCTKTPPPEPQCYWCSDVDWCPYTQAKNQALRSDLAVVNTSYFLSECNYVGYLSGRPLIVADEADTLEQSLMGFVSFTLSEGMARRLHVQVPKKGSHKTTIMGWMEAELVPAVKKRYQGIQGESLQVIREKLSLKRFAQGVTNIMKLEGDWVRDNDAGPLVIKPLKVNDEAEQVLWRHGGKWLCMSGTIISGQEMAESLGLEERGIPWQVVSMPMHFPVENRKIIVAPVANMIYSEKEEAWPKVAYAIQKIMERHPEERILVHTVSYALTKFLMGELRSPRVIAYTSSDQREGALSSYLAKSGSVLLASSFDRGIDLKGDDCRVVVVAKVPFPSLGDRQISDRVHSTGGQLWYNVQTVRKLVQMTGRGVRSKEDWCLTYILDQQFQEKIMRRNQGLLPQWWKEAVDQTFPVKQLRER